MKCGSRRTKKKGFSRGSQRYFCKECSHTFGSLRKPSRLRSSLWHDFVFKRYTATHLAAKHGRSTKWILKELRAYKLPASVITPGKIVAVMDCVFFGRTNGYLVVRDHHRKCNIYWSKIQRETLDEYRYARVKLESLGFDITAVVADGKPGLKPLFGDVPIQMCHFHQKAIITRYLTSRPRLQAGIELRNLVYEIGQMDEQTFTEKLQCWHSTWHLFLSERTVNPDTGKWHYTHKRLRSAYKSLKSHLPCLFTYQKYPNLNIPNTTNGLEGSFSYLKELVRVHRGVKPDLKHKIINAILQNRPTKS